jgi:hypothetical protein
MKDIYTVGNRHCSTKTMFRLSRTSLLLLISVSITISIHMNCYFNAGFILPSNAVFYDNVTFEFCQCLLSQENITGFMYDNSTESCYILDDNLTISDLRVMINSQVCFVNQTNMVC